MGEMDEEPMITVEHSLVSKFLYSQKWYNPNYSKENQDESSDPENPAAGWNAKASLLKAWDFYEKHVLYRYIENDDNEDDDEELINDQKVFNLCKGKKPQRKARETKDSMDEAKDSKMYTLWGTHEEDFDAWGIGIYVYFYTLKYIIAMFLMLILFAYPVQLYYGSDYYNGGQSSETKLDMLENTFDYYVPTAICTNREFVICTDCSLEQWKRDKDSFGTLTSPLIDSELSDTNLQSNNITLVQKNKCNGPSYQGSIFNFLSLIFVFVVMSVIINQIRKKAIKRDEEHVSAEDYTIAINSPPPVYDPDVWAEFFAQFELKPEGGIPLVTIALNNEELLKLLLKRRAYKNKLESMLLGWKSSFVHVKEEYNLDDEDQMLQLIETLKTEKMMKEKSQNIFSSIKLFKGIDKLTICERILKTELDIKKLIETKTFVPTKVFVTMETEQGQRNALEKLTVGKFVKSGWLKDNRNPEDIVLFQDKYYLNVRDCVEPNAIRWMDVSDSPQDEKNSTLLQKYLSAYRRKIMRYLTVLFLLFLLVGQVYFVRYVRDSFGTVPAGLCVTVANQLIPKVAKAILTFEKHSIEDSYQASMYTKITIFRWTNTVILPLFITPFTRTLSPNSKDLIKTVVTILATDITVAPIMKLLNIGGLIKKHIRAPRVNVNEGEPINTQEKINNLFKGSQFNLGERYTDFTKILFICFFYSSLIPNAFYIGFIALVLKYWTDKYLILRIAARQPYIGESMGELSIRFILISFLCYLIGATFLYSGFPFDNLCLVNENEDYTNPLIKNQNISITTANGVIFNQTVTDGISVYKYCNQDLWFRVLTPSPSIKWITEWMTVDQIKTIGLFDDFSRLGYVFLIAVVLYELIGKKLIALFKSTYKPHGKAGDIRFRDVLDLRDILAYVPQVKSPNHYFHLLCSEIKVASANTGDSTTLSEEKEVVEDEIGMDPEEKERYRDAFELIGWIDIIYHRPYDFYSLVQDFKKMRSGNIYEEIKASQENANKDIFSVVKYYEANNADQDEEETDEDTNSIERDDNKEEEETDEDTNSIEREDNEEEEEEEEIIDERTSLLKTPSQKIDRSSRS